MIGSALRQSEEALAAKVSSRLPDQVTARMWSLIAAADDDPGGLDGGPDGPQAAASGNEPAEVAGPEVWAAVKSDAGNVSLNTCKSERRKLDWIRAVGLPRGLFADIAPKIVAGWRVRAAVESPSHLRNDHSGEVRWTLMAAYLYCREREITDALIELLIATVHRINARAEAKTRDQFVSDIARKVTGKENILYSIVAASAEKPQGLVEEVGPQPQPRRDRLGRPQRGERSVCLRRVGRRQHRDENPDPALERCQLDAGPQPQPRRRCWQQSQRSERPVCL